MLKPPPPPMTAADVDLRSYDFMPLKVAQLRNSDLAAEATDAEFRAAVLLWCACWHEVPAASLPDDDRKLCRLAGLHRDLDAWMKVKEGALRHFELCSDGRFYHGLIADLANVAWEKKRRNVQRTANATASRLRRNDQRNVDPEQRNVPKKATKGEGEGEGHGEGEGEGDKVSVASLPVTPDETAVAVTMWNRMAEKLKLPLAASLDDTRRKKLRLRLEELGGLEGWALMLEKIAASKHLRGENDRGWAVFFPWVLKPENVKKIMEGTYDDRRPVTNRAGRSAFVGAVEDFQRERSESEQDP